MKLLAAYVTIGLVWQLANFMMLYSRNPDLAQRIAVDISIYFKCPTCGAFWLTAKTPDGDGPHESFHPPPAVPPGRPE